MFVKSFVRDRTDDMVRSFQSTEPPFLGKTAMPLAEGAIAGPVVYQDPEHGPQYCIVKCIASRPAKQLSLDEARKSIETDFKEFERKQLELKVNARLKAQYKFQINREVLAGLVSRLVNK
jgi:hypothetical protein